MPYKDPEKQKAHDNQYNQAHREERKANLKKWRIKRPDYQSQYKLAWKLKNPEKSILKRTRQRAKEKGIEFSIVEEDIIIPDVCPLLGIPLESNAGKGKGATGNSPSIDRIDPTKGYVKGNVWIISMKANAIKNEATLAELELLTANLRQKLATHS